MEIGLLLGLPLLTTFISGGSSSKEGNSGVSGGVNNLSMIKTETRHQQSNMKI